MPAIRLLTSASAARLEDALVEEALASSRGPAPRPAPRVAIVVPGLLAADRVQHALAIRAGAGGVAASIETLHLRRLAARVLERAFLLGHRQAPPPRLIGPVEREGLIRRALAGLPPGSTLRRDVALRPRLVASLERTLEELRLALVPEGALADAWGDEASSDLPALHALHVEALNALEREANAVDAAGHALAAGRAADALGALLPWGTVFVHAPGELAGAQVALLEAVARAAHVTVLASCGEGPAHDASRAALAEWPGVPPRPLDEPPSIIDGRALFDEESVPVLPEPPRLEAVHCRGVRAELDVAVRLAAEAHLDRGVPLEEIAIVARSLEPYAGLLDDAFTSHGVPYATTAGSPLRREPWAQCCVALLDALGSGLARAPVMDLLRSPWARLAEHAGDPRLVVPDLWEEWTLAAGVVRGGDALVEDVLAWHETDVAERARRVGASGLDGSPERDALRLARVETLGRIARALDDERAAWNACEDPRQHAAFLTGLLARWLRVPSTRTEAGASAARAAALSAMEGLGRLDDLPGPPEILDVAHASKIVRESMDSASTPLGQADRSGVRVLTADGAAGQAFREIVLIGMNQGAFPRRPRQDPFLPEAVRARLRRAGARHLVPGSRARSLERRLLATVLGAASERAVVAWQRADEDGRARAASAFLREIARVTLGRPDLELLTDRRGGDTEAARRLPLLALPGHPAMAARALRLRTRRASWRDALLEASEIHDRRRAVGELADGAGRGGAILSPALGAVALMEAYRFEGTAGGADDAGSRAWALAHDGVVGPGLVPPPEPMSASSLESLGRCALRWFFERGLGLGALDDPTDDVTVGSAAVGTVVHAVLEETYRGVMERGGSGEAVAHRETLDLLDASFRRRWRAFGGTRRRRAPVLWDGEEERWLEAVREFVRSDASRLSELGARVVAVEQDLTEDVSFRSRAGRVVGWPMRGRIDRLLETADGWRVEDYKTSASVAPHVLERDVLKGVRLQGVLYQRMAEAWAMRHAHPRGGEAARVEVAFLAVHPDAESDRYVLLELHAGQRASVDETLDVLHATLHRGVFALQPGSCSWCDFAPACRRASVPAQERLLHAAEARDYADVHRKSTRKLDLATVRAESGADTQDDDA